MSCRSRQRPRDPLSPRLGTAWMAFAEKGNSDHPLTPSVDRTSLKAVPPLPPDPALRRALRAITECGLPHLSVPFPDDHRPLVLEDG